MDYHEASTLLEALANGVDPLSGEILPDEHICHQPQIIRALFLAVNTIQRQTPAKGKRTAPQFTASGKAGKPWKADEDGLLRERFGQGLPIQEIADLHERSRGGITSRLVRLGLIEERDQADMVAAANRRNSVLP